MKRCILSSIALVAVMLIGGCSKASASGSDSGRSSAEAASQLSAAEQPSMDLVEGIFPSFVKPTGDKPLVIDFSATWCGPCRKLKPIFEKLEKKYAGKVEFVTIDVDANAETAQKYGVQAVPTIWYVKKDGNCLGRSEGFLPEADLEANILYLLKAK